MRALFETKKLSRPSLDALSQHLVDKEGFSFVSLCFDSFSMLGLICFVLGFVQVWNSSLSIGMVLILQYFKLFLHACKKCLKLFEIFKTI